MIYDARLKLDLAYLLTISGTNGCQSQLQDRGEGSLCSPFTQWIMQNQFNIVVFTNCRGC